jgi:hypothetical protein
MSTNESEKTNHESEKTNNESEMSTNESEMSTNESEKTSPNLHTQYEVVATTKRALEIAQKDIDKARESLTLFHALSKVKTTKDHRKQFPHEHGETQNHMASLRKNLVNNFTKAWIKMKSIHHKHQKARHSLEKTLNHLAGLHRNVEDTCNDWKCCKTTCLNCAPLGGCGYVKYCKKSGSNNFTEFVSRDRFTKYMKYNVTTVNTLPIGVKLDVTYIRLVNGSFLKDI